MAHPKIESFIKVAPGKFYNPDNAHGYQCVDLIDAYAEYIFPGEKWEKTVGPVSGGARELIEKAPKSHWTHVWNNATNKQQVPPRGAVVVFNGDGFNRWGHTGIVVSSNAYGLTILDMDGFAQRATRLSTYKYSQPGTGMIRGWLIPRVDKMPKVKAAVVNPKSLAKTHTVKAGENLTVIGKKYKMSASAVAKLNGMSIKDTIFPNQKLKVNTPAVHTVKAGDSLSKIATAYGTTVSKLVSLNKIKDKNVISVNQKIKIG